MICAIPFCSKDVAQAIELLDWIKLLGGCKRHDALLVADAAVQWSDSLKALDLARESFQTVELISTEKPFVGWPLASNAMFAVASSHLAGRVAGRGQPFFWCEPDCIPLKPGWLDALESEYLSRRRKFLGAMVRSTKPGLPQMSLGGCAVYPPEAAGYLQQFMSGNVAWDVASAETVVPMASDTKLVQWFWGQPQLVPTFSQRKTVYSTINTFTLDNIRPEAVVFHRNKDGTLIRLLKQRMFPGSPGPTNQFIVVIPFCNRDSALALKNVQWQVELGGCRDYDCLLAVDSDILGGSESRIREEAKNCFRSVETMRYRCGSTAAWPQGANVAFRHTCHRMAGQNSPWLWLEPDAIPVRSGWLDALQREYDVCGKLFMGPVVPGMGHVNGVCIYPAQTEDIIPNAISPMLPHHIAWDWAMKNEMIHLCYDASKVIQHVWGIGQDGNPHPSAGDAPVFDAAWKLIRWVNPTTVLFHRCKDGSLIDCIREFQKMNVQ